MRKYFILLLLPFLFGFTFDGKTITTWDGKTITTWNGVSAGGAVAEANAYYYTTGNDSYGSNGSQSGDVARCSDITIVVGGTITTIGIKAAGLTGSSGKFAIYNTSGNLLNSGCSIVGFAVGWNDCTLGTPYNVSSSAVVRICANNNGSIDQYYASSSEFYYDSSSTYAAFPQETLSLTTAGGACLAYRVYVD